MAARSIREEEEARADSCCTLLDSCCWTLLADSCFTILLLLLLLLEDSCFCCVTMLLLLVEDSCFCESKLADSLTWPMLAKDTDSRACEDDLRWGQNI